MFLMLAEETVTKALEVWTLQNLADITIVLTILAFLIHIGRPYALRILNRFTLRVAADIWWLIYVISRDGSILLSVVFGLMFINLDIMQDIKIAVPFFPFAVLLMAIVLLIKLATDVDNNPRMFRVVTFLLGLAALLNFVGFTLVMEAASPVWMKQLNQPFWASLRALRSNLNPHLSMVSFYITFPALLVVGFIALIVLFRRREK
ncbi:MAG: hypothetical protein J7L64_03385 [Acidobacteria bacterium]|nr:hypothetical protein [Acidobacteriota bacterium]